MRTLNFCRLNNESSNEIPNEKCIHNKSCICDIDGNKCTNTRYVRADVAIRYARMIGKRGYVLHRDYGHGEIGGIKGTYGGRTYEEAVQAAQREGAK